jgi:hypothetical protein
MSTPPCTAVLLVAVVASSANVPSNPAKGVCVWVGAGDPMSTRVQAAKPRHPPGEGSPGVGRHSAKEEAIDLVSDSE